MQLHYLFKTYLYINSFDISWSRRSPSHWHLYILYLHYSHSYYTRISTFTFPFTTLGSHIRFANHSCVWCLFTFNEIFFLRSQKGDGVVDVDYLKGVFALSGLQPPVLISGPWPRNPIKISTSSTSSYLKSSHYDHVHITFNGLRVIYFMLTYSCHI